MTREELDTQHQQALQILQTLQNIALSAEMKYEVHQQTLQAAQALNQYLQTLYSMAVIPDDPEKEPDESTETPKA